MPTHDPLSLAPPLVSKADDVPDIPYQAIVEQTIVGVYVLQDERFCYVNQTWASMFGRTPQEMTGMQLQDLVPADFLPEVLDLYWRRIKGDIPSAQFITRGTHSNGSTVLIEVHGTRMQYRGQPAVVGVGIDVTERVQRDKELEVSRQNLRELAAHINTIREDQRAKFARELHDVLGGMLTSIKMDVTRIKRRVKSAELQEITEELRRLTQDTIDTVRSISEELRPSILDHLGLYAAIDKELGEFSRRYRIRCSIEKSVLEVNLSEKCSTSVYRVFQEALTNIAKHANATAVQVALHYLDGNFCMLVEDNGLGIDASPRRATSIGLLSMSERAREMDGRLDIESCVAGGTRLYLRVPLQ